MSAVTAQGVFEFLKKKGIAVSPAGLEAVVHGTVPQGENPLDCCHCVLDYFILHIHPTIPPLATTIHRLASESSFG